MDIQKSGTLDERKWFNWQDCEDIRDSAAGYLLLHIHVAPAAPADNTIRFVRTKWKNSKYSFPKPSEVDLERAY